MTNNEEERQQHLSWNKPTTTPINTEGQTEEASKPVIQAEAVERGMADRKTN